ncbi:MAG: hypothetical protein RI971_1110, partial [Chloroflexota bacterium]
MSGLDEAALPGEAGPNDLDATGEAALDQALRSAWMPVCQSAELTDRPLPVRLFGESLVVVRLGEAVAA